MAAPLVAELLGGTPFLGFIAAVAFATILAVVAGLTLAGASALSHDIFVHVVRKGHATEAEQVRVARIATVVFGARRRRCSESLFKGQNVAFMVGPRVRDCLQRELPAAAAVDRVAPLHHRRRRRSIVCGASLSVALILVQSRRSGSICSATPSALFPLRNPAIISMTVAFAAGIVGSLLTREPSAEAKFDDEKLRTYLGVGAE